ncbi:Signal transduction histidine kinase [Amycolatopsis pretoriensis]|uniref:histidine kinase n=1 Tax=Amycolatopsis pretoriensis TaxID=218821 RepID=A0A1H5QW17_9PSEU|nr:sensor histidine kinase [Amycolatopsis pretoriensis]SEF30285.1 Signal transduction histidine kinase [Amycolatopsis pretoriensis]
MRWQPGWSPWVGRVVRTIVVTGFVLGATSGASRWDPASPPMTPGAALWLVGTGLTLLLVHRFPLTLFLVTAASAFGYYASGLPGGPVILVPTIALFVLTRQRGPLVAGITGSCALAAAYVVHVVTTGSFALEAGAAFLVVWLTAVIGVGTAVRYQLDALAARREQADEHRHRLAEQERLRIAREVHDVVAHSLAMINVQAGVAAHVADRRPEQAKEALLNIKAASASALNDLRATLAVLRSGEDKAPAPSLAQAAELLDHARDAGLSVDVHGEAGDLPAPVDAAAYRILQESLTNVVRHADQPDHVDVRFERKPGAFVMKVRDDGRGTAQPTPGHGLRGMGERAAALGGRCTAGPVDGGFEVCVELPIEGEA